MNPNLSNRNQYVRIVDDALAYIQALPDLKAIELLCDVHQQASYNQASPYLIDKGKLDLKKNQLFMILEDKDTGKCILNLGHGRISCRNHNGAMIYTGMEALLQRINVEKRSSKIDLILN